MREVIIVLAILLTSAAAEQTESQPTQTAQFLGPQQVNELPASAVDHRIHYGDDPEQFGDQVCGDPVITRLVGGSPIEVPDRYRAASPSRLLPIGVRQVVITGAHDRIVPAALGRTYEETARAHGDDVTALVVPDAAHFEVIAPGSKAWPVVRDAVLSILGLPAER